MSILQEYEQIRKDLGEEKFHDIERYLEFHPEKLLSDLYYNSDEWKAFEEWCENTVPVVQESAPIVFVVQNWKGLCEHNFIGTKEEICEQLNISSRNLDAHLAEEQAFYHTANITYEPHICNSIEDLEQCLSGIRNTDMEEIKMLNPELAEEGVYDDWYWDNDLRSCGTTALEIAKRYVLSSYQEVVEKDLKGLGPFDFKKRKEVDMKTQRVILQELGMAKVKRHWFSVTQGEAEVLINGESIVQYGDDMWLKKKDGTYSHGTRILQTSEVEFFKENADGWGSILSDERLIEAALQQFPEKVMGALGKGEVSLETKIEKAKGERVVRSEISKDEELER